MLLWGPLAGVVGEGYVLSLALQRDPEWPEALAGGHHRGHAADGGACGGPVGHGRLQVIFGAYIAQLELQAAFLFRVVLSALSWGWVCGGERSVVVLDPNNRGMGGGGVRGG